MMGINKQSIDAKYRSEFDFFLWQKNINHIFIFCCLGLVLIFADTIHVYKVGSDRYLPLYGALYCVVFFIFPFIAFLNKRRYIERPPYSPRIEFLFLLDILIFSASLSLTNQFYTEAISEYLIILFCAASFFYVPLPTILSVLLIAHGFFVGTLFYVQSNTSVIQNHILISTGAVVIAFIVSRISFQLKTRTFLDGKIIEEQLETLKDLSIRDSMTGLYNHKHICQRLEEEIRRAFRYDSPLSVGIFKNVNDTFGHQEGDVVILRVAQTMILTFRNTDILGRYGGDEFLVILPETNLESAVTCSERFRKNLLERLQGTRNDLLSISGGIATLKKDDSAQSLIQRADTLLYEAKKLGKNTIVW